MEEFSDNLERAIREVRAEVVMRTYSVALAVASILFFGNMVRNLYLGNSLSIVHTVLYLFFVTVFLFRSRIGAMRMAVIIALTLYAVGCGGLFLYGIAANSAPVMMGFCFIAALFFGLRGGIYAALLTLATYLIAATLLLSGTIELRPEADILLHSGIGWFSAMLTIAAMAGFVAAMTGQLKDRTVDLVRQQYLVARTDALTGLPNRLTLETRLQHSLEEAHRVGDSVAVFFLDLDRFKAINDTLGHHVGDRLLWEVAQRLRSAVRAVDTVARLGGDEFVLVQEHIATEEDATQLAGKVLEMLVKGIRIEGQDMHCSVSIGIAMYPQHGNDVAALLKHADMAMYHAKASGRNNFRFYVPEMSQIVHQRSHIETGLRNALLNNGFLLYYQPQVTFDGALRGYEALLRWASPDQGIVEPEVFLAIAEESELVSQIGDWVLESVCRQWAAWDQAGLEPPVLSINLASRQVCDPAFPARVAELRRLHRMPANALRVEVHERTLIDFPDESRVLTAAMAEQGVGVAIDDFGTAFSNLSLLRSLKLNYLKIDRSFIRELTGNAGNLAIVKGTVSLAHTLGLQVLAEGVETREQLLLLREKWCDELQGHVLAPATPAEEAELFMRSRGQDLIRERLQLVA